MKKILAIMLVLILALSLLTACGGGGSGSLGNIVVPSNSQGADGTPEASPDGSGAPEPTDDDQDIDLTNSAGSPGRPDVRLVEYIIAPLDECFLGTYHYEYDKKNRLVKITADATANSGVWDVTYPDPDTVHYENAGFKLDFTYGGEYITIFEGNPGGMNSYQELEYEGDYLTKTTTEAMGMTTVNDYIWNDGVLDAIEMGAMGMTIKTDFTYGDIPNAACSISPWITSHQGNWYSPTYFCGDSSPYLLTSEVQGMTGEKVSYRYELDADGYVTKVYSTKNGGEETLQYEVIYLGQ